MTRPDARLALPAACGWVATAVVIGFPQAAIPALAVAWIAGGALVLLRPRLALIALVIALCCTSVAVHASGRQPPFLLEAATAHRSVSAIVSTTQTVLPGSGSFEATLEEVDGVRVVVPILVFGSGLDERIGIGARVALEGTLVATEAGDDRAFLLFPRGSPTVVEPPPEYLDWANGLRARFLEAATRLPGDGGDLLAGLAIGDTSAVGPELDEAMKASSLTHLTAVSGANCVIPYE